MSSAGKSFHETPGPGGCQPLPVGPGSCSLSPTSMHSVWTRARLRFWSWTLHTQRAVLGRFPEGSVFSFAEHGIILLKQCLVHNKHSVKVTFLITFIWLMLRVYYLSSVAGIFPGTANTDVTKFSRETSLLPKLMDSVHLLLSLHLWAGPAVSSGSPAFSQSWPPRPLLSRGSSFRSSSLPDLTLHDFKENISDSPPFSS